MSTASTVWTLWLTDPEPQVPEALRGPAQTHLAQVLDQPFSAISARLAAAGEVLAETRDAAQALRWQAELRRAGWLAELRETAHPAEPPPPGAPPAGAMAAPPPLATAVAATPSVAAEQDALPRARGEGQAANCPACGARHAPRARFCEQCGGALDGLPALPGDRDAGALLGPAGAVVARVAGLRPAQNVSVGSLVSEAFARRTPQEIEAYMSVGTTATTPPVAQLNTEWPRPWLFARLLFSALLVTLMLYASVMVFGARVGVPGLLVVSCFVVPLTVVLLFFELNVPRNVTLIYVLGLTVLGGVLSILVSLTMFELFPQVHSLVGASAAGLIEELGKLLAVVYATRRLSPVRYRYILNGMLFGAAVGAGFAAFESAGYGFVTMLKAQNVSVGLDVVMMRGWMAPFGHVLWTALTAGALWRVKGAHSYSGAMLADWRFVRVFLIVMACHAIWNASIVPIGPFMLKFWILGAVGWMMGLSMVQEGLEQVRREQRTVGA